MGADLLLTGCPVPVGAENESLDNALALPVLKARIAALSDKLLAEVADWCCWEEIDTEARGWQADVRRRLVDCLEVFDRPDATRPSSVSRIAGGSSPAG